MTNTPTETMEAPSTEVEAPAAGAAPAAPEARPPFWHRPLVERYFTPLVLPVLVIVGLVAYVLNISRIFLSGHGHIPVIVGSIITAMILVGAAMLSAASPRLRQSAVTLVGAAFVISIMSSGWLVLGHSQPEKTGPTTLSADLKTKQSIAVTAGSTGLNFSPDALTATTGLAKIDVSIAAGGHTFNLRDPATTLFPGVSLDSVGATKTVVVFFPTPGKYEFFCATPGHDTSGMHGTITVTGPAVTLTQALTAAGNAPTAAG